MRDWWDWCAAVCTSPSRPSLKGGEHDGLGALVIKLNRAKSIYGANNLKILMLQRSKGLTAVIALVLLLMMTVAGAGFFYIFSHAFLSKGQYNVENTATTAIEQMRNLTTTCMSVDSVFGNKLYLRNCGTGKIINSSLRIYLDGAPVGHNLRVDIDENKVGVVELDREITFPVFNTRMGDILKITTPTGSITYSLVDYGKKPGATVQEVTFTKLNACPWRYYVYNGTNIENSKVIYTVAGSNINILSSGGCADPNAPKDAIYGSLIRRINKRDGYDGGEIGYYRVYVNGGWHYVFWKNQEILSYGLRVHGYVDGYPELKTRVDYIALSDTEGIAIRFRITNTGSVTYTPVQIEMTGDFTDGCGNCGSGDDTYCGGSGAGSFGWCAESWMAHDFGTCDGVGGLIIPKGSGSVRVGSCLDFEAVSSSFTLQPGDYKEFLMYDFIVHDKQPNYWTPIREIWLEVS